MPVWHKKVLLGADEFDDAWEQIYDEADSDRVWIDLHSRPKVSLAGEAPGSYQPAADGEPGAPR